MLINFQATIGFASRTKKLRQIPNQHPEQIKKRKIPRAEIWKSLPEATAYKTANFEDFQAQLKNAGLRHSKVLKKSCQREHIIGIGGEKLLFRIPIKGFEGYAIRTKDIYTSSTTLMGIEKNESVLENDPNAGVVLASISGLKGKKGRYQKFEIVRRLPTRDMHTSVIGDELIPARQNPAKQFSRLVTAIANAPLTSYKKLVRQCYTLFSKGQTFDAHTSNFTLLPDQSIGIFDFKPTQDDDDRRTGLIEFVNMFDGYTGTPVNVRGKSKRSYCIVPPRSKAQIIQKMQQAILDVEAEEQQRQLNVH